jgi:hypothetical protein
MFLTNIHLTSQNLNYAASGVVRYTNPHEEEGVAVSPLPPVITPPKKITFFVMLEQIWHPQTTWRRCWELDKPVIVITDLTEEDTVKSLVTKVQEKSIPGVIQADKTWRVFFPHNLPSMFVWKFDWEKRSEYLVNMTKGDCTLKEIGISADNNRLVYFHQFQFESRDEP